MRRLIYCGVLALGLGAATTLSGCVAAAVGVGAAATYGAVKHFGNDQHRDFPADLDTTWTAVVDMLRRVGHEVPDGLTAEKAKGYLEFEDFNVQVDPQSNTWTRVTLKVGTFDSSIGRRRAKAMLDSVDERLRDFDHERGMRR